MSIEEDKAMVEAWLWESRSITIEKVDENLCSIERRLSELNESERQKVEALLKREKARIAEVRAAMERLEGEK